MPNSNPAELLAKFRADLKLFEESGETADSPAVAIIREHLGRRIAELEAALRRVRDLESARHSQDPQESQ